MHAATQSLASAKRDKSPKREELRAYACEWCAGAHLTSQPANWRDGRGTLSCRAQSPDGFPCSLAKHDTPDHVWESPCPSDMPNVTWSTWALIKPLED